MNMRIEIIPAYEIAYIRQTGPYGLKNIQTMEKLKTWATKNNLLNDESILLGIPRDNPQTTKSQDCRYDACLIVAKDQLINHAEVQKGTISAGNYAVFEIDHTAEAVAQAWSELFEAIRLRSCTIDYSKPIIERYSFKMVKNHRCEICVPIYESASTC